MQRINPMARLIALAGALAAAANVTQGKDLAAKLHNGRQHDPQSGRYAYRGRPRHQGVPARRREAPQRDPPPRERLTHFRNRLKTAR